MNRTAVVKNNNFETFSPHSSGILQRKCACGQQKQGSEQCSSCQKDELVLQRKEKSSKTPGSVASPSLGRTSGQPLGASLAQHFRPSLGSLIDRVRIHNDSSSGGFAHRQNAVAVASGTDIYFARGTYQAGTTAGRNLIAHELAHVHQQHRSNGPPAGYRSTPGDTYEKEADRFAETGRMPSDASSVKIKAKPVFQQRTAAEQIATTLRQAADGLGTDEEAIFNALTGRTAAEITDIKAAYLALSGGESLEAMLRDELSRDDLSNALSLLQGETAATETARRLWNAMRGLGTDEEAIYAAVAGRTAAQWADIQTVYQTMSGNGLLVDLRDDLNDSEWRYLQTLLPGATGGAVTDEDRATVIANQLEAAMAGLGTDEEAIYTALTGRSNVELRAIEARFRLLTGSTLDVMLRDELSDSEYNRVRLLLNHDEPLRVAMRLRDAVEGMGTDELEIQAILTGRTPADLILIHTAYQTEYGESLSDRLNDEFSGTEQTTTNTLRQQGVLPLEDEIKLAIEGAGTDEERLFAVLTEIKSDPNPAARLQAVGNQYAAKGYGNMVEDIVGDLSSSKLEQLWADFVRCPSVKTVSVDFVRLAGSTGSPASDLGVANRIFKQCCVQFSIGKSPTTESEATTRSWLGGDTDLATAASCSTSPPEETSMFTNATAAHSLSSRIRAFYPASVSGFSAHAYSITPSCAASGVGFANHTVIYPTAFPETLAHEFGHILLNSGLHTGIVQPSDERNIMFSPRQSSRKNLDNVQCQTIYANA